MGVTARLDDYLEEKASFILVHLHLHLHPHLPLVEILPLPFTLVSPWLLKLLVLLSLSASCDPSIPDDAPYLLYLVVDQTSTLNPVKISRY